MPRGDHGGKKGVVFPAAALSEMKLLLLSYREGWKVWYSLSWQLAGFGFELPGCNIRRGKGTILTSGQPQSSAQLLKNLYVGCIYMYSLPCQLHEITRTGYCSWGAFCFTRGLAAGWGAAVAEGPCPSQ